MLMGTKHCNRCHKSYQGAIIDGELFTICGDCRKKIDKSIAVRSKLKKLKPKISIKRG